MALISWVNFNSPRKYFVCHNAMLKAYLPHDGLRFSRKCTIDFGIVNEIDAGANCSSQYFNLPTVRIPDFKHCELNNIYIYIIRVYIYISQLFQKQLLVDDISTTLFTPSAAERHVSVSSPETAPTGHTTTLSFKAQKSILPCHTLNQSPEKNKSLKIWSMLKCGTWWDQLWINLLSFRFPGNLPQRSPKVTDQHRGAAPVSETVNHAP